MGHTSRLLLGLLSVGGLASATLTDCLNGKKVPISLPGASNFQSLAAPFNQRLPYNPAVIILPTTQQHITDAVVCAGSNNVKVQPKGGGHSYASYSSGGKDGSMVIDLANFHAITLDTATGIVKAGGGVRLGNLAQGIYDQGKRALPHGLCPGVGLGGHASHGGWGYDSRLWGLAMDTIVALDVVLPNGTYIHATPTAYPNLYWALRGAAESFGVIVNFYMQTLPAPAAVTWFKYDFSNIFSAQNTFTNTVLHLQDVAYNASVIDGRIGWAVYMDNYGTFVLQGTFIGPINEFNSKIGPALLRTLPGPSQTAVQSLDWISALIKTADAGQTTLAEPTGPAAYTAHDTFFAKSVTVPESAGLTAAALNNYYNYIKGPAAPAPWFSIMNLYGGPGSVINKKDTNFAAYNDRDSLWVFQHYGHQASNVDYINGLNNALTSAQSQTKFGAYLNYVDPTLSAATAHSLYYGDAVYNRLLALKKIVDPKLTFWNPQAIGA